MNDMAISPGQEERLARLETQVRLMASVLEELTKPKLASFTRPITLAEAMAEDEVEEGVARPIREQREAEHARVDRLFGLRVVENPFMPPGEIRLQQAGEIVARMVGLSTEEAKREAARSGVLIDFPAGGTVKDLKPFPPTPPGMKAAIEALPSGMSAAAAVREEHHPCLDGPIYPGKVSAQREADLFAPRGKQWDKSAGLETDERDTWDNLDQPNTYTADDHD